LAPNFFPRLVGFKTKRGILGRRGGGGGGAGEGTKRPVRVYQPSIAYYTP